MFNQKSIVIIFIDRTGMQFFGGTLQSVISVQIPSVIVDDMEVLSKDGLYSLIKQWVKQYTLVGSQIVFVLSDSMYFEKLFSISEQTQIETDILKFIDMVPFESIWSKVYPAEKGKRVLAINKALYDAIHQGFLLQGLPTKSVIPAFALGQFSTRQTMDVEMATYIMNSVESLSKMSLLDPQDAVMTASDSAVTSSSTEVTKKKSNLPMLLSIFGVLLLILGVVVYMQFR